MDDRYEELEKVFKEELDKIDGYTEEQLKAICDRENLDYEGLTEKEIREALKEYFKEELGD